ncbi:MAG: metal ABC transporter permease [Rickettsiaceae bacterium]|nr:metal ABC transporter permease [Rickettsiaceae bacterium]
MATIILVSILIGLIFAPLGCFVLWKRYVYFGDGLAHASMLALAISVIAGLPIIYAGIVNTLLFALLVFKVKTKSGNNAAIGMTSSIMISLALIVADIFPGRFNFNSMFFGDIITATSEDVFRLCIILGVTSLFLVIAFRQLILTILSRDIAHSRGIRVKLLEFLFLSILSFAVIATIKIVGALLVTSMILIPAMIARLTSNTPIMMIWLAIFFAGAMNLSGVLLSLYADLPFAPIVILCGGVIYLVTYVVMNSFSFKR